MTLIIYLNYCANKKFTLLVRSILKLKKNCKKVTNDAIYGMIIFSGMTFKINAIKLYYLLSWPCMVGDYVDNRLQIFFYFFQS